MCIRDRVWSALVVHPKVCRCPTVAPYDTRRSDPDFRDARKRTEVYSRTFSCSGRKPATPWRPVTFPSPPTTVPRPAEPPTARGSGGGGARGVDPDEPGDQDGEVELSGDRLEDREGPSSAGERGHVAEAQRRQGREAEVLQHR